MKKHKLSTLQREWFISQRGKIAELNQRAAQTHEMTLQLLAREFGTEDGVAVNVEIDGEDVYFVEGAEAPQGVEDNADGSS